MGGEQLTCNTMSRRLLKQAGGGCGMFMGETELTWSNYSNSFRRLFLYEDICELHFPSLSLEKNKHIRT